MKNILIILLLCLSISVSSQDLRFLGIKKAVVIREFANHNYKPIQDKTIGIRSIVLFPSPDKAFTFISYHFINDTVAYMAFTFKSKRYEKYKKNLKNTSGILELGEDTFQDGGVIIEFEQITDRVASVKYSKK